MHTICFKKLHACTQDHITVFFISYPVYTKLQKNNVYIFQTIALCVCVPNKQIEYMITPKHVPNQTTFIL